LECKDASGRQVATVKGLPGFLRFTYEIEWEGEARQRLEQEPSVFSAFRPHELRDGERSLARFEPLASGCLSLFRSMDRVGRTAQAEVLARKRWFARVDPSWPALASGELLEGRVDYEVQVGGAPTTPLFVVQSSWFGTVHVVNRLPVQASPEEERLALMCLLLTLAHRHLRPN